MNVSNLNGKKVLIRVDFNVPLDKSSKITDDTRIVKSLPTIKKVLEAGASVILMSHLGRPKIVPGENNTAEIEKNTLRNLIPHLSKLLNTEVKFSADTIGNEAFDKSLALKSMMLSVLLIENMPQHIL
jgi:phosphoglycerate kinase